MEGMNTFWCGSLFFLHIVLICLNRVLNSLPGKESIQMYVCRIFLFFAGFGSSPPSTERSGAS